MSNFYYNKKIIIIFSFLFSVNIFALDTQASENKNQKCKIYFASALFSQRERQFNTSIASAIEKNTSYEIFLPQKNGFEFSTLEKSLEDMSDEDKTMAMQLVIYYLDMSHVLDSNVVIVILDEELDPGAMVEICYAKLSGKKIIGVRTDARSPYAVSSIIDPGRGMHFFALFQLDYFIYESDSEEKLIQEIITLLHSLNNEKICREINLISENKIAASIKKGAEILFNGIDKNELNNIENIKLIATRYKENKTELQKIYPEVVYHSSS